jgi:caffeoyl-CoA O-methyltransferase
MVIAWIIVLFVGDNSLGQDINESNVMKLLTELQKTKEAMLNVPREDGQMLRLLAAASGARTVLEIGTSNGVSAIWIGLAVAENGGKITTLEINPEKVALARENFKKAGMEKIITVIEGDALEELAKLAGSFDFVFIDANKPDYKRYFDLTFPKLAKGGLIVAHNTYSMAERVQNFLDTVENHPQLITQTLRASETGMTICYRKK